MPTLPRPRRHAVAAAVALALAALVATFVTAPDPSEAASQSGRIAVLPSFLSPVSASAGGPAAKGLVTVSIKPARAKRSVTFYRKAPGATSWTKVKSTRTSSAGSASAAVTKADTYAWRVKAGKAKGLKAYTVTASAKPWRQKFADDFRSKKMASHWRHRYPNMWRPGRTCGHTSGSQVKFTGKAAVLTTKRADRPKGLKGTPPKSGTFSKKCKDKSGKPHHYVGASMDTSPPTSDQFAFTHGVAAARIKFSKLAGQHAAFWLQTKRTDGKDTEIDIVESNGAVKSRPITMGLHYWSKGKAKKVQKFVKAKPSRWSKGYHTFSVEWSRSGYVFRIDSTVVLRTSRGLSNHPHDVVLSNFVADWEISRNSGKPASAAVDWVRVWQR